MQTKKNNKDSVKTEEQQESTELNVEESLEQEAVVELSKEEQLEKEIAELKDKQLRIFAEFENFKKRTAKERIDLFRNAGIEFFESMLTTNDPEEIKKGIDLIHSKLLGILNQKGLCAMDSSIGSKFDTDFHEAITQIPSPSDDMKGNVIDETEKGYLLNDKVIRYAKVVVGQ